MFAIEHIAIHEHTLLTIILVGLLLFLSFFFLCGHCHVTVTTVTVYLLAEANCTNNKLAPYYLL